MALTDKIKGDADKQAIAMALDQLSETMEVMQQIVRRLKHSVDQANQNAVVERQRQAAIGVGNNTASNSKEATTVNSPDKVRILH